MSRCQYFTIPSDWARGRAEILCLSIITGYKRPEVFKTTLEAAVTAIKATPYIFKAFYPDMQGSDKDVGKKREELDQHLAQLCQDVVQAKKEAIVKQKLRARSRDHARDKARDQGRDDARDQARDQDRDQVRDQARDVARDKIRDQDRDQHRDQVRDKARYQLPRR